VIRLIVCPLCGAEVKAERIVAEMDPVWAGATRLTVETAPHPCDVTKWPHDGHLLATRVEVPLRHRKSDTPHR